MLSVPRITTVRRNSLSENGIRAWTHGAQIRYDSFQSPFAAEPLAAVGEQHGQESMLIRPGVRAHCGKSCRKVREEIGIAGIAVEARSLPAEAYSAAGHPAMAFS